MSWPLLTSDPINIPWPILGNLLYFYILISYISQAKNRIFLTWLMTWLTPLPSNQGATPALSPRPLSYDYKMTIMDLIDHWRFPPFLPPCHFSRNLTIHTLAYFPLLRGPWYNMVKFRTAHPNDVKCLAMVRIYSNLLLEKPFLFAQSRWKSVFRKQSKYLLNVSNSFDFPPLFQLKRRFEYDYSVQVGDSIWRRHWHSS